MKGILCTIAIKDTVEWVNGVAPTIHGSEWVTQAVVSSDCCCFPVCDDQFPTIVFQLILVANTRCLSGPSHAGSWTAHSKKGHLSCNDSAADVSFLSATAAASTFACVVFRGKDKAQRSYRELRSKPEWRTSKTIAVSDSSTSDELGWRGGVEPTSPSITVGRQSQALIILCRHCELWVNFGIWLMTQIWEGSLPSEAEAPTLHSWFVCGGVGDLSHDTFFRKAHFWTQWAISERALLCSAHISISVLLSWCGATGSLSHRNIWADILPSHTHLAG